MRVVRVPLTPEQTEQLLSAWRRDQEELYRQALSIYSAPKITDYLPYLRHFSSVSNAMFEELTEFKIEDLSGKVMLWVQPYLEEDALGPNLRACWLEATLKETTPSAAAPRS